MTRVGRAPHARGRDGRQTDSVLAGICAQSFGGDPLARESDLWRRGSIPIAPTDSREIPNGCETVRSPFSFGAPACNASSRARTRTHTSRPLSLGRPVATYETALARSDDQARALEVSRRGSGLTSRAFLRS